MFQLNLVFDFGQAWNRTKIVYLQSKNSPIEIHVLLFLKIMELFGIEPKFLSCRPSVLPLNYSSLFRIISNTPYVSISYV